MLFGIMLLSSFVLSHAFGPWSFIFTICWISEIARLHFWVYIGTNMLCPKKFFAIRLQNPICKSLFQPSYEPAVRVSRSDGQLPTLAIWLKWSCNKTTLKVVWHRTAIQVMVVLLLSSGLTCWG